MWPLAEGPRVTWIFRQIKAYLYEGILLPEPTVEEVSLALRHLGMKVEYDGEARAVQEMRPHMAWYLKGIPYSAETRKALNLCTTSAEVEALLKELL